MVRTIIGLFALAAVLLLLSDRKPHHSRSSSEVPETPVPKVEGTEATHDRSFRRVKTQTRPETAGERVSRLLNEAAGAAEHRLTPVEVADYLARYKTNAFTLVTAFNMTGDLQFLRQAAELNPHDPIVQSQLLVHEFGLSTEDRQNLIEAFKKSSPGNSFANFLAAKEYLDHGDVDAAVREIKAAGGKSFDDFTKELALGQEEAYLTAGRPQAKQKLLEAPRWRFRTWPG